MRHTLLIGAAIFPLAVIAATPATTTTGAIAGNGHAQSIRSNDVEGVLAARFKGAKTSKVKKEDLRKRANSIRPRGNRLPPVYDFDRKPWF